MHRMQKGLLKENIRSLALYFGVIVKWNDHVRKVIACVIGLGKETISIGLVDMLLVICKNYDVMKEL